MRTCLAICVLLAVACGCTASERDCAALGDKFVELYEAELTEASRKLPAEVLSRAAEAGRTEVVAQCKTKRYSKTSVRRCLDSQTLAEFEGC